MEQRGQQRYILGLDIGIASVGWCVMAEDHIIDLGVRAFDRAEVADSGEPLNLQRRMARLMRHRIQHRRARLVKLARTLVAHGLIPNQHFFKPANPHTGEDSLWALRVKALSEKVGPEEWARILYHICKHRGFHWVSRAEQKKAESESQSEGGKIKQGLQNIRQLMQAKGYESVAQMLLAEFPEAQRNKQGEYTKAVPRALLDKELALLFERQAQFGTPHATASLKEAILGNGDQKTGLLWQQKPSLSGEALLAMLGKCSFEPGEYRAPKASFTAEQHVWLTRLNNLRVTYDGKEYPLTEEQRRLAYPLPYQQSGDFTYKQLRKALLKAGLLPEDFKFKGITYPSQAEQQGTKQKNPEDECLIKLPAWQALHKCLKDHGLETEWQSIAGAATGGDPALYDKITWVLSVYKEDEEVERELQKLPLPNAAKLIPALLEERFEGFHALSLKALNKIVPPMLAGARYDQACLEAGYHHSQSQSLQEKQDYLPSFYQGRDHRGQLRFAADLDIPRNPVVLRALNQARKVINAIIKLYGPPDSVHIEMARDLSRPYDKRKAIEKEQKRYRDNNDKVREDCKSTLGINRDPSGREFEAFRLYREQNGQCAYSGEPIDLYRLTESGYVEVDHALPYSRSYDDSKNNKVLVLTAENRNKGNQTPYGYLGGVNQSPRWLHFKAWVENNKNYRGAKKSLLLKADFGKAQAEDFMQRNLNDTRYICRFLKNYIEQTLKLHPESRAQRCLVVSGQFTSFLRARWGLMKLRAESDRHHALDAAVIAAASFGMVKRLSDYARRKELDAVKEGFVDPETGEVLDLQKLRQLDAHFPKPWAHFQRELEERLHCDDVTKLRSTLEALGTYPAEALQTLQPLFVSRAPKRRKGGAAHEETIYHQSPALQKKGKGTKKVALSKLTLEKLGKAFDDRRNRALYAAIRKRLEDYAKAGGKFTKQGNKAFPPDNPLYKPSADGQTRGPVVRSIKLIESISGIRVHGGLACNGSALRVDIFTKAGEHYLVPIYIHHRTSGLPQRAVVAKRNEKDWTLVDDSFQFLMRIYPNDFIEVVTKTKTLSGYYIAMDRSNGSVDLWSHDRNINEGKGGKFEGIGLKTALSIKKYHVDVLGRRYSAAWEPRRGLA